MSPVPQSVIMAKQGRVLLGSVVSGWLGWLGFSCFVEKLFSIGLVDQRFQPASNQVETVEKAFA